MDGHECRREVVPAAAADAAHQRHQVCAKVGIRDGGGGGGRGGLLLGARGQEHGLGTGMLLRNEGEVALHAAGEARLAQVVVVDLQALVSDSDERRLIAAVAGDANVDKGVLLGGRLLLLLLLLLIG